MAKKVSDFMKLNRKFYFFRNNFFFWKWIQTRNNLFITIKFDIILANNWRLRTSLLLSHSVWTEASQIDISLCLSVRPGHELELCKPVKVMFAPKPVKRAVA